MKSSSFNGAPQKTLQIIYFDIDLFKIAFQEKLKHLKNDAYSVFTFKNLLNEHAPLKTKTFSCNKNLYNKRT